MRASAHKTAGKYRRSNGRTVRRSNKGSAEIAEFVPVLYVLFLLGLMPILDLVSVFVAATTQYLATNDFAAKAATQPTYSSALNTMVNEAYQFQSNGLAQFVHMVPDGGYTGSGDDMFVLSTNIGTGNVLTSAPNQPLAQTIDTQSSIYELSVKSVYNVSPLVNLESVPLLGDIPGLGKPVTLAFTANRPVEHPGGLQTQPGNGIGTGAGNIAMFPRVASTPAGSTPSATTWRNPNIFDQITNAGQTVVSVNVVLVLCDSPTWTSAGITVQPGQKLWLDTQAVGQWWTPGLPVRDANGIPNDPGCPGVECQAANFNSLVGVIGITGTIQPNTASSFFLGNQQFNYMPTGTGLFSMANNDWSFGTVGDMNYGAQLVRIIVTN